MQTESLKRHMEAIYNRCYRILKDPDMAWDALQDVFESFYLASKTQHIERPLYFLYRCSTNHCLNILKREKRLVPWLAEYSEPNSNAEKLAEHRLILDELIQQFGEETIQLFVYRHVDQMTLGEIADLTDMSDRGVKKKLERLETQIRQHFQGTQ